jgi:3-oxoacyl-[acyl-carrier protein] reductase
MDLGLKDRVAIVAASSQGIGKATAIALASEGVKLAICARTPGPLEQAAAAIRSTGAEVFAKPVDVTDEAQVRAFVSEVLARFGRIDICVANAGGPPSKSFAETTVADWRGAVDLNLMSTLFFAREVIPHMRASKWGRFLTITSISVKQPIEGLVLSNSVRSAVLGLVKTLANECSRDNVLVNNVCPGYTATARLKSVAARLAQAESISVEEVEKRWAALTPIGRIGQPEELASLIVFLASEQASYITGTSIAVDGGLVRGV